MPYKKYSIQNFQKLTKAVQTKLDQRLNTNQINPNQYRRYQQYISHGIYSWTNIQLLTDLKNDEYVDGDTSLMWADYDDHFGAKYLNRHFKKLIKAVKTKLQKIIKINDRKLNHQHQKTSNYGKKIITRNQEQYHQGLDMINNALLLPHNGKILNVVLKDLDHYELHCKRPILLGYIQEQLSMMQYPPNINYPQKRYNPGLKIIENTEN